LVKWLLAFPQYILVGVLVGSGYVVATSVQDGRAVSYSTPSLIGACVVIAAIAMLFTTRYPPGLFDLVLGIDRWGYRLLVYVALMTTGTRHSGSTRGASTLRVRRNPLNPVWSGSSAVTDARQHWLRAATAGCRGDLGVFGGTRCSVSWFV
jgi:hypothetical protein